MACDASIGSAYHRWVGVELRHLRALDAVVQEGTFGAAASRLGYTQSSVSQQIAALERAVGGALFDRPGGPRAARLTALGELVHRLGGELLRDADGLQDAVERFAAGDGRLDIGTFQSVSTVVLPALVGRLRAEFPDCEVRLAESEVGGPRIGDLDLLFTDAPVDDDVESVTLLDDPYVLVARPGDFPDGPVRLEDLSGRAMVAWPATCDQPRLERALQAAGSRPHVVFRSAGNETLLSMVRAGLGFTILPRLAVTGSEADDRLRLHALCPTPSREIQLHRPRRRRPTPLSSRAVELATQIAQEIATGIGRRPL